MVEAAWGAVRTRNSSFAAQYRRLAARRGPNKASVAVGHSMVVSAWHMLSTGEPYRELGADYYTRRSDPEHQARRLTRQLETLGYTVSLTAA